MEPACQQIFEALMQDPYLPIVVLDESFTIISLNEAFSNLIQEPFDSLQNKNFFQFYYSKNDSMYFQEIFESGKYSKFMSKRFINCKRTVSLYCDWHLSPIKNHAGQTQALLISFFNVNEIKETNDSLIKLIEMYKILINGFDSPLFLLDSNGFILIANEALSRASGVPVHELIGKDIKHLDKNIFEDVSHYQQAIDSKEKASFTSQLDHHYFRSYIYPYLDIDGSVKFLSNITHDITEEKLLSNKLIDSEEKLRTIIMNSPVGIILREIDGTIVETNLKNNPFFQVDSDKLEMKSSKDFYPSHELFEKANKEILATDGLYLQELSFEIIK